MPFDEIRIYTYAEETAIPKCVGEDREVKNILGTSSSKNQERTYERTLKGERGRELGHTKAHVFFESRKNNDSHKVARRRPGNRCLPARGRKETSEGLKFPTKKKFSKREKEDNRKRDILVKENRGSWEGKKGVRPATHKKTRRGGHEEGLRQRYKIASSWGVRQPLRAKTGAHPGEDRTETGDAAGCIKL